MRRLPLGWLVVVSLIAAACRGGAAPSTTTAAQAPVTTTTRAPLTTTTTPATTTTQPPPPVTVALYGSPPDLTEQVKALYLWVKNPTKGKPPPLPQGLIDHLRDLQPTAKPLRIRGAANVRPAFGGHVAVVIAGRDVILAAEEGQGWRIVGAELRRFGKPAWYGPSPRMVLVIGSDARPGQVPAQQRSDSLHIVTAAPPQHGGAIVGIPRDAWVTGPGGGNGKITNIMPSYGPEGTLETVRRTSGLPLEGYFLTGFAGFTDLVNEFGGFPFEIPFAMSDFASQAYFDAGPLYLWGPTALAFARNRHIPGGDFTRSLHQGMLIEAVMVKVRRQGIAILPNRLELLSRFVTTDLPPSQVLTLGAATYQLDPARVENIVVPGGTGSVGAASVVFLDWDEFGRIAHDLRDGMLGGAP